MAPYFVLLIGWRIVWAISDYGVHGIGFYVDPIGSPLRFAIAIIKVAPILLLAQWTCVPADLYALYDALHVHLATFVWLAALVFVAVAALLMQPVLRRNPVAQYWTAGMALSVIPICALAGFPMDRLLLFVSLGALGLLAMFLQMVWDARARPQSARPHWWRATAALAVFFFIIHVIISPVSLLAHAIAPMGPKGFTQQFYVQFPDDADLSDREIIVVNAPGANLIGLFPLMQAVQGKSVPRRVRMLGPTLSAVAVTRVNERQLRVKPEDGFLFWNYDHFVRSPTLLMPAGHEVALAGMTVTVAALTEDGRPAEADFTFDVPLEDPALIWLQWREGSFVPFQPPPVGQTVELPRAMPLIGL
jgi:hypothetical protein